MLSTGHKERHETSQKVIPKHLNRPLVVGCGISSKPLPTNDLRIDMGQKWVSIYLAL